MGAATCKSRFCFFQPFFEISCQKQINYELDNYLAKVDIWSTFYSLIRSIAHDYQPVICLHRLPSTILLIEDNGPYSSLIILHVLNSTETLTYFVTAKSCNETKNFTFKAVTVIVTLKALGTYLFLCLIIHLSKPILECIYTTCTLTIQDMTVIYKQPHTSLRERPTTVQICKHHTKFTTKRTTPH